MNAIKIPIHGWTRSLGLTFASIVLTSALCSCAGPPLGLVAPELLESNSMSQIAILGEATVEWPRIAHETPAFGLHESLQGLNTLVPLVKKDLETKGYEVMFAEPAILGAYFPGRDKLWVFDSSKEEAEEKKWLKEGNEPVAICDAVKGSQELAEASTRVFEGINAALKEGTIDWIQFDQNDLRTIQAHTFEFLTLRR